MNTFTPALNIPKRKTKGMIKMMGGISIPWYFISTVAQEGTPVKLDLTTTDKLLPCVAGASDGAKCLGFLLQETYDDSVFGQLKGYHFANDTRQRLDGNPVGVLGGSGYAYTNNYTGVVSYGKVVAVGASGKLIDGSAAAAGDKLTAFWEGSGTNGDTMVRVRFAFPMSNG